MNKIISFFALIFTTVHIAGMSSTRPQLGISVLQLKGTAEALGPEYENYAPYWGLVFAEKGVARNLYEFSAYSNKKMAEDILKRTNNAEFKPLLETAIQKYLAQDHNTATQNLIKHLFHIAGGTFNITAAPDNPVRLLQPKHIGIILRLVHNYQGNYKGMEEALKTYFLALITTAVDEAGAALFVNKDDKKIDGKSFNRFVNALVGAVQECDERNPQALFAPNTAQGIVLGYLLIKAHDRHDLQKYIEGFLGRPIDLPIQTYSRAELEDPSKLTNFGDWVCSQIYMQKYASLLPKIVEQNITVFFKGFDFPDCMEVTVRNLCNIATYDQGLLGKNSSVKIKSVLEQFCSKHHDPNAVTNKQVHQDWADMVENISGASYLRLGNLQNKMFIKAYECQSDGFIPIKFIPDGLEEKLITIGSEQFTLYKKGIGDKSYLLVPRDLGLVCYDLRPQLRNIPIIMNEFFDIDLYQDVTETFQDGFALQNFNKICQIFNWNIVSQEKEKIIVKIHDHMINIHLLSGHAYVTVDQINLKESEASFNATSAQAQAALIALGFDQDLEVKASAQCSYYYNLSDPNMRLSIIFKIAEIKLPQFNKVLDNLLVSMSEQQDQHFYDSMHEHLKHVKTLQIISSLVFLKYNSDFSLFNLLRERFFTVEYVFSDQVKGDIKNRVMNMLSGLRGVLKIKSLAEWESLGPNDITKIMPILIKTLHDHTPFGAALFQELMSHKLLQESHIVELLPDLEIMLENQTKNDSVLRLLGALSSQNLLSKDQKAKVVDLVYRLGLVDVGIEKGIFDAREVNQIVDTVLSKNQLDVDDFKILIGCLKKNLINKAKLERLWSLIKTTVKTISVKTYNVSIISTIICLILDQGFMSRSEMILYVVDELKKQELSNNLYIISIFNAIVSYDTVIEKDVDFISFSPEDISHLAHGLELAIEYNLDSTWLLRYLAYLKMRGFAAVIDQMFQNALDTKNVKVLGVLAFYKVLSKSQLEQIDSIFEMALQEKDFDTLNSFLKHDLIIGSYRWTKFFDFLKRGLSLEWGYELMPDLFMMIKFLFRGERFAHSSELRELQKYIKDLSRSSNPRVAQNARYLIIELEIQQTRDEQESLARIGLGSPTRVNHMRAMPEEMLKPSYEQVRQQQEMLETFNKDYEQAGLDPILQAASQRYQFHHDAQIPKAEVAQQPVSYWQRLKNFFPKAKMPVLRR